jgi:hypothetical protein
MDVLHYVGRSRAAVVTHSGHHHDGVPPLATDRRRHVGERADAGALGPGLVTTASCG